MVIVWISCPISRFSPTPSEKSEQSNKQNKIKCCNVHTLNTRRLECGEEQAGEFALIIGVLFLSYKLGCNLNLIKKC